ncbi:MAG: site-specific DNA-methyltransferase [Candidatus Lokiarchaeota archaeon]|nr:site-specific DNA-methyltransferase [Candidatus Harpocratesius repetitus]
MEKYEPLIFHGSCENSIKREIKDQSLDLSFLDPPFNQDKYYHNHSDNMKTNEYWTWMKSICEMIYQKTKDGGVIYFMQREKNTEEVLRILRETNWVFQNLIIWKKMTSAVPQKYRYGKHYQIIAFFSKGERPKTFHKIRYDAPLEPHMKIKRDNGLFCTDVWTDIRELTSGYFAGHEALREEKSNKRLHKQQSPIALLLRILLSSTKPNDLILDPFAGTGTTNIVAKQLRRRSIGIEKSEKNIKIIRKRISEKKVSDNILKYRQYYRFTENLDDIWPISIPFI